MWPRTQGYKQMAFGRFKIVFNCPDFYIKIKSTTTCFFNSISNVHIAPYLEVYLALTDARYNS